MSSSGQPGQEIPEQVSASPGPASPLELSKRGRRGMFKRGSAPGQACGHSD